MIIIKLECDECKEHSLPTFIKSANTFSDTSKYEGVPVTSIQHIMVIDSKLQKTDSWKWTKDGKQLCPDCYSKEENGK